MRTSGTIAAASLLLLAACDGAGRDPAGPANGTANAVDPADPASNAAVPPATQVRSDPAPAPARAAGWDLLSSGEGTALVLSASSGGAVVTLFCPAGADRLTVNVPGFRPVGSEERMTFGSGGEAATLVADPRGDPLRGGVTGTGAVPGNLAALVAGPVAVNYGSQNSGPHPAPSGAHARGFAAACNDRPPAPAPAPEPSPPASGAGACLMQGSERLRVTPLRAVGTEPFWGARIEGRCVTYSHPDDQSGTRVWTRYTPGADGGGTWEGALGGRRFVLRTRAAPGCSDGMSDRRYPIAVDLLVGGERRRGCAVPL